MRAPLTHLNGTGKRSLLDQYARAHDALNVALKALADARPNGRDFYPLGPEALREAEQEHTAREAAVLGARDEIEALWTAVEEGHTRVERDGHRLNYTGCRCGNCPPPVR